LETVKVKRKGQVTIPAGVRRKHGIREGNLLSIEAAEDGTIIMKLKKPLEPGKPVGLDEQRKILKDLEKLREKKNWR
jgi:AbrB family looped-hinge helix DNA binding protein